MLEPVLEPWFNAVHLIFYLIGTSISAQVTAFKIRRRIRRAIGWRASEVELTSISIWMRVSEAERRREIELGRS